MAFISLIFTALNLKKLKKNLIEEKLDSINADAIHSKKFKFRHVGINIREGIKHIFKNLFKCSDTNFCYKTCYKLGHEGSCENYFFKSILGFFSGVLLTYFLYIIFIFQLNAKLTNATLICSIMGCILTTGLAFSSKVRCVVLLTLPQFFSKRGRQALLAYAFILALTGPAQNTLDNLGILSDSLACGQEQLKQAVKQIIDVIKKPFLAIKEAIKKVIKTVKVIVKKIKEIFIKIKRVVMGIVRVIKSAFEFLGSIINICNKELGTPFDRCTRVFENAIADCNAKLGPLFSWLCSITYIVKAVCYLVKIFDYICMIVDFISNSVVGVIVRKIKIFIRHIKTMFYVRIKFSHHYEHKTVASNNITHIAKEIVKEVKERSRGIVAFFNFMTSISMLFFCYLLFQVAYYRFRFLTSERYDNVYINKYFHEIDQRRAKSSKETVLPLTKKEQQIYAKISATRLVKVERKNLSKSATKLAAACVKLGTHIIVDFSLYWILTLISRHARYQSKVQPPNFPKPHISGEGFLAKLLKAIVEAFQPIGIDMEIDTVPCLPIPIPPNYDRYMQIGITILICWILTVFEPYGLRFRNFIMGYYYPIRAKQRTIWLYNHILRSRNSFLLLFRRKLRKKFGKKNTEDQISCNEWIRSKLKCSIFRICFGKDFQLSCLLCGEIFRKNDKDRFIKCSTPNCPGLFCLECFKDLKNICPICLSPLEYGDIHDEEKDSSGDDPPENFIIPEKKPSEEDKKKPEESDTSTDYSYSYQYDENLEAREPLPEIASFKDLEMQKIPDEASMQSFREGADEEYLSIDLKNEIKVPKGHVAVVELDIKALTDEETETLLIPGESDKSVCVGTETDKLLSEDLDDYSNRSQSSSSKHVEFIGVPKEDSLKKVKRLTEEPDYCICSEDFENICTSTMSTSTKSDCKYCNCSTKQLKVEKKNSTDKLMVPELDFSFLNNDNEPEFCTCSNNEILSNRFSYVTYKEENETPPPSLSRRSLESSSLLSSLLQSPELIPSEKSEPILRRRKINLRKLQQNSETDSPSSMDSTEFNKIHNKKVRQYYKNIKEKAKNCECGAALNWKKPNFIRKIKNFLPKRKKKNSYLPLCQREVDEEIELRSYNYSREDWDNFSSPTYPFNSEQSSTESSDEEKNLLTGKRIRGGRCSPHFSKSNLGDCPDTRAKNFHTKSECYYLERTILKDFSTLSLPPRPKPANSQELFFRHFRTNPLEEPGANRIENIPMQLVNVSETNIKLDETKIETPVEPFRLESEDTEDPRENPSSSDSVLSEETCIQLFGKPCPIGLSKKSLLIEETAFGKLEEVKITDEIGQSESNTKVSSASSSKKEEVLENLSRDKLLDPKIGSKKSSNSDIALPKKELINFSIKNKEKLTEIREEENIIPENSILDTNKKSAVKLPSQVGEISESLVPSKALTNRNSTQLNQLLYKDGKTEISLVQKLNPSDKSISKSSSTCCASKRVLQRKKSSSAVKLQISLHNSIIPEEEASDFQNYNSMRSETMDSFPLHHNEWTSSHESRCGKLISSNDKTQQTSDYNLYRNSIESGNNIPSNSSAGSHHSNPSIPAGPSSRIYYFSELPEKDVDSSCNMTNCKCPICALVKTHPVQHRYSSEDHHQRGKNYKCSCCASPRCYKYMPTTVSTEFDEFLLSSPPPPPPPSRPPARYAHQRILSPRRAPSPIIRQNKCSECCTCGMQQSFYSNNTETLNNNRYSGDFGKPCKYPTDSYYNQFPPSYEEQYVYSNEEQSLSDLPYQNNEDYLELVEELQDTLHTRNRNRVKRAMQEFEDRSKRNKPLDKPIIDYDETSESEEPIIRKIDQLRIERKICCPENNNKCNNCMKKSNIFAKNTQKGRSIPLDERPSHWTMDPGSGEWHKASKRMKNRLRRNNPTTDNNVVDFDECNNCSCFCEHKYQ